MVAPNPVVLAQEQTAQLQVSVLDPDGALLTGIPVAFSTADAAIATVSNVGLVTSVGPAGTTSISIKAGNKTQGVPVTISATSSSIVINPDPREVPQLGTLQLQPSLIDVAGNPIPGAQFQYLSSNPAIADVSATGLVTSVGPAGLVTISVTSDGIQATGAITVQPVPTSLALTPEHVTMAKGTSVQFVTTVRDAVGEPMSAGVGQVTYSATPSTLLSISSLGRLTASDHGGDGSVTVTNGALSGTAEIRVVDLGPLTGETLHHITADGLPYGVAVSDAGGIYGVAYYGTLHRGSLASSSMEPSVLSEYLTIGVAVNAAGDRVYVTGSGPDGLMEVDAATGARLRTWDAGQEQLYDVVLSPDGQTIYVAGESGVIHPIDATTFESGSVLGSVGESIVHLLHHPTQPLLYASGAGHAREFNTQAGTSRSFNVGPAAQASALALAGERLFVAGENEKLDVISLGTGSITTVTNPGCAMYDIVATPGGEALLATCAFSGTAQLLDPESALPLVTIQLGGDPRRVAISADGTRAVIANQAGWFDIIQ